MEFLSRVLKGLVVGVANIIPGVSGGTMAVVMGIYDRLIGAVSDLRRDFKNSLLYLFPIGIGAVLGIVLFSHLIKFLLEGYPMPTNLFFLGLILGSIPMIFRRARKESFQKSSLLPFAVSFAVMLLMTIFQNVSDASSALITTLTPLTAIRLLLSAAVAAACMIMPGISGSMVMVLLGIFFGAKGINWCMKRYEQQTYFAILGLIAGSVPPILLNAGFTPGVQTIVSLFTLAAGAAIAWWMGKLES